MIGSKNEPKKIVFLICQVGAQTSVGLRREFEEIYAQETNAQNHHQSKRQALPKEEFDTVFVESNTLQNHLHTKCGDISIIFSEKTKINLF